MTTVVRCPWVGDDPLMVRYHDEEWGVAVHDDRRLFEYMVLDAFQAGLSWRTILNKRAAFDTAFAHFVPEAVAAYGPAEVERLLGNAGIVRNRQKIEATIGNAERVLEVQKELGGLAAWLWSFVDGHILRGQRMKDGEVPATSAESDAMSQALRARGFKFVGSTICYAFMQSAGLVNDHLVSCFRYDELNGGH